jgi:hypothetical protein
MNYLSRPVSLQFGLIKTLISHPLWKAVHDSQHGHLEHSYFTVQMASLKRAIQCDCPRSCYRATLRCRIVFDTWPEMRIYLIVTTVLMTDSLTYRRLYGHDFGCLKWLQYLGSSYNKFYLFRVVLVFNGQSSCLHNGDVLWFLRGTNWIYICYVEESRPPLWSSGQSSWLQVQGYGFDSRRYQIFFDAVSLERGPLSLVSTTEELLERKVATPV